MPPRTIDNYPLDTSTRYAEDQKLLDKTILEEAGRIPVQTRIEVTLPTYPSEIDVLLDWQLREHALALFLPPDMYFRQRRPLFTSRICPSLGSEDMIEALMEKVEHIEAAGDEEEEKKTFLSLFQMLSALDKMLVHVNNERSRTQKG